MPQMSALMWFYLYTSFSLLILASIIKMFFTSPLKNNKILFVKKNKNFNMNWTW